MPIDRDAEFNHIHYHIRPVLGCFYCNQEFGPPPYKSSCDFDCGRHGGPHDCMCPDQRTLDRQEDLYRIKNLEDALIEAMVKIHMHVMHCGTNFENSCLELFGVEPPPNIHYYAKTWQELKASR